jgi:hypothetical protein
MVNRFLNASRLSWGIGSFLFGQVFQDNHAYNAADGGPFAVGYLL